ncbi:MurR/RpiR family transcriptional regulator [Rubellimicrobium sp. CFH 75288]|uniref:MurR/RpiR family transcriptional regulator n=1 Tax=Rubellimicrobium sp. CFH 75288 TaxID=2697034 RepID=UPI00141251F4|nr:MurR/RpiR family transcriptional regulator [Rubellimicrobium sp. CFH 75288]NAZ35653.1 SIS domain-containing protein [Rubellimicrobium sp. CFH 75288]
MSAPDRPAEEPIRDYDGLVAAIVARGDRLSRRHAEVAHFLLNHPEDVAVSSIVRLAARAGVTPATITRFAQEMGLGGFSDLQALFRERLLGPRLPFADRLAALRAAPVDEADLDDPGRLFEGLVAAAVGSLLRIEEGLDRAALGAAVEALVQAGAVHVAAARGAFGIGAYAVYGLARSGKRAHLVDNLGAMRAEQVAAMAPGDVLLALTFDDYTPETVEIARHAAAAGHAVLAVTDNPLSPVVPPARHVLYVKEARLGHFRSQVPALVLCQTLIASVARRLGRAETTPEAKRNVRSHEE